MRRMGVLYPVYFVGLLADGSINEGVNKQNFCVDIFKLAL